MASRHERRAQKLRTREALLDGARALLAEGATVTVAAAAARSGISKPTAYRYFSDPAMLAAEAGLAVEVKDYREIVAGAETVREKLRAISLYFLDLALDNEAAFRQFLARTLDAWNRGSGTQNRRGARRIAMFEYALNDVADDIGTVRAACLVRGLATATGAEAMIALLDVVQSDRETARATALDIADALIDRHLGPNAN